jgi:RNA polymerase sigma-70 factor (ECF subfamily)
VQETYLRAWRAYPSFQERSSIRTWLYRIATNACLTALEHRSRRPLPSGLGAPAEDPYAPPGDADLDVPWLRPIADALVTPESADPAVVVAARASLRLALIAGLQYLPARQRAVLILREVLGFPAAEVAEMLDTSVAAVKSTLQRARARLDEVAPSEEDSDLAEPDEPAARALLGQYIAAFERSDVAILERALRTDASLELLPSRTWFAGKATCMPYISQVLGKPGDWQMRPTRMNGQQAAVVHYRGTPFGVAVLSTTATGIRKIVAFGFPDLATQPA